MPRDVDLARAAAVQTFLAVRGLAHRARGRQRAGRAQRVSVAVLDTLACQAEAALRGHAACSVAVELAAADPAFDAVAIQLERAAADWAAIVERIANAARDVHARALDIPAGVQDPEGVDRRPPEDPHFWALTWGPSPQDTAAHLTETASHAGEPPACRGGLCLYRTG